MSFLSHFVQAKPDIKHWKCQSCCKRITLKAHAANHKKQSSSMSCRAMGFVHINKKQTAPVSEQLPEVNNQDDGDELDLYDIMDQEKMEPDGLSDNLDQDQDGEFLQMGDDMDRILDSIKKKN